MAGKGKKDKMKSPRRRAGKKGKNKDSEPLGKR
jgi:hypothetical protein